MDVVLLKNKKILCVFESGGLVERRKLCTEDDKSFTCQMSSTTFNFAGATDQLDTFTFYFERPLKMYVYCRTSVALTQISPKKVKFSPVGVPQPKVTILLFSTIPMERAMSCWAYPKFERALDLKWTSRVLPEDESKLVWTRFMAP